MNDEYIRLDTTIIAIDNLINEAATGTMVRTLFKAKDTIYNQQRYVIDVQPVKRGMWITKAKDYYKKWQNSGRSWDDMSYFVTGEHIACSECFTEYDVCTEGIEHWIGCPCCLARMDGDYEDELRSQNDAAYVRRSDVLDLITEAYEGGSFTDYSDYSSLWDAVDDMSGKENVDNDT